MNIKNKLRKFRLALIMIFSAGIVATGAHFILLTQLWHSQPPTTLADASFGWKFPSAAIKFPSTGSANNGDLAYSSIRDPGGIPQGLPVRLQIPVIGVDSAIEDATITPDGRMDVPVGTVDVAWFALGPHPGDVGSAVIGGHYGIQNGVPFVFYNLDKVKVGDKIYIVNDENNTLAFQVRSIESFDRNADATTVFTSNDGLAHLNLITCEGIWNEVNGTYPQRLILFADAIPAEGAVTVKALSPGFPTTSLVVPTPTPPPVPSIPATIVPNTTSQNFATFIKNLYDSPADGVISSLLVLAIIFIGYKIIRR